MKRKRGWAESRDGVSTAPRFLHTLLTNWSSFCISVSESFPRVKLSLAAGLWSLTVVERSSQLKEIAASQLKISLICWFCALYERWTKHSVFELRNFLISIYGSRQEALILTVKSRGSVVRLNLIGKISFQFIGRSFGGCAPVLIFFNLFHFVVRFRRVCLMKNFHFCWLCVCRPWENQFLSQANSLIFIFLPQSILIFWFEFSSSSRRYSIEWNWSISFRDGCFPRNFLSLLFESAHWQLSASFLVKRAIFHRFFHDFGAHEFSPILCGFYELIPNQKFFSQLFRSLRMWAKVFRQRNSIQHLANPFFNFCRATAKSVNFLADTVSRVGKVKFQKKYYVTHRNNSFLSSKFIFIFLQNWCQAVPAKFPVFHENRRFFNFWRRR